MSECNIAAVDNYPRFNISYAAGSIVPLQYTLVFLFNVVHACVCALAWVCVCSFICRLTAFVKMSEICIEVLSRPPVRHNFMFAYTLVNSRHNRLQPLK